MAAHTLELHHAAPRCLLRLREEAEDELRLAGVGAWLEFEHEAQRWGVPVEISREDLAQLVEASTVVLDREKHRMINASDWQRWGRRFGGWFSLRELAEVSGGGNQAAPAGICRRCADRH